MRLPVTFGECYFMSSSR